MVSCFFLQTLTAISSARVFAHDHALVYLRARADEQRAALLRVEQAVADRLAGFKCDQRAGGALGNIALVRLVAVEDRGQHAFALGVGQELGAVAEQAARRDEEH